MTEAIAFFAGLLSGLGMWYYTEITDNPYLRGFDDGYKFAKMGERKEE